MVLTVTEPTDFESEEGITVQNGGSDKVRLGNLVGLKFVRKSVDTVVRNRREMFGIEFV